MNLSRGSILRSFGGRQILRGTDIFHVRMNLHFCTGSLRLYNSLGAYYEKILYTDDIFLVFIMHFEWLPYQWPVFRTTYTTDVECCKRGISRRKKRR